MPNLKSPMKELRADKKRRARNSALKSELKTLEKKFRNKVSEKNAEEADATLKILEAKFDKAASKKIIRREKAARKTSRLSKKLSSLSA